MPVITRNMLKNGLTTLVFCPYDSKEECEFMTLMNYYLFRCQNSKNIKERFQTAILIFKLINNKLAPLLNQNSKKWNQFVFVAYNKVIQLKNEYEKRNYDGTNYSLNFKFTKECDLSIYNLSNYLNNLKKTKCIAFQSQEALDALKNLNAYNYKFSRPHRNINRVNYSGMDYYLNDD